MTKFDPTHLFFNPLCKKILPPHFLSLDPHLQKNLDPPTSILTIRTLIPPLNFTACIHLCYIAFTTTSATFHQRLKVELFQLSYTESTPAPPNVDSHHRLQS